MEEFLSFVEKLKERIVKFADARKISDRDKRALKIAALAVVLFFGFMIFKGLFFGDNGDAKKVVVLRDQLEKVKALKNEYEYSKNLLNSLTSSVRKEEEALISVVEKILVDNNVDRKSFSIKDSNVMSDVSEGFYDEKVVQVDVKKIDVQKVLDVLYSIQTRESFLKVSNLKLKTKFGQESLLDMSFRLSTFELRM